MSFKFNNYTSKRDLGLKIEDLGQKGPLFHAIYFLDHLTGSLLISKKYSNFMKSNSNEDLISGFLSALNLFIKEIKPGNDEIQEINFKNTRILYEKRGRLSVIAITSKSNLRFERQILDYFVSDFYKKFGKSLDRFNGNIEPSILNYKNKLNLLNSYDPNFKI